MIDQHFQIFGKTVKYDRFPLKLTAGLYLLSYGFHFLFLNAYFWDDWLVNYQLSAKEASQYWKEQLGFFPTNRFIEINLLNRNPVAFHILTLIIFFLVPVIFFRLSRSFSFLTQRQKFYMTVLLTVLPIYSARVSMACFRLSYSLLLFLVAWLVLADAKTSRYKYLALPLFLISFLAQSLIPFFLLPCVHSAYMAYVRKESWQHKSVISQISLLLLPLCYYVFVWKFDPPVPERTDYFTPSISGSARAILFLSATSLLFILVKRRSIKQGQKWASQDLFALSFVLLAVGSFAYMTSGRLLDISEWLLNFVPSKSEWDSRHQLLLGIGLALFLAVFVDSLRQEIQRIGFLIVVTACVVLNFSTSNGYYLDSIKQTEFIQAVSSIEGLENESSLVIVDHTGWLDARGRSIRSYEWKAMIHKATKGLNIDVLSVPEICSQPEKIVPQVVLVVDAPAGRLKALVNGKVNLSVLKLDAYLCY